MRQCKNCGHFIFDYWNRKLKVNELLHIKVSSNIATYNKKCPECDCDNPENKQRLAK